MTGIRAVPAASANAVNLAHRQAERVIREHSRTFYLATGFLAGRARRAVRSLYGFCRATDDLVDRGNATVEDVERWRAQVALPPERQTDPVLISWAATREEFGLDRRYEQELIDGVRMDITKRRYATWEELQRYCYLVASTVGLLSIPVLGLAPGADPQRAAFYAVRLGIALQLTNILRDVAEDLERGRIYLPLEDLRAHGVSEKDIERRTVDADFTALLRFEIERARALYREALPGIALLSRGARAAVGAAALLYRGILDEIEASRCDVFSKRAHLTAAKKILRLPGILRRVASLRMPLEDAAG
ncbi:MAG: squalene/phytoene synthase family protein [Anaerolineales bacterium]|nr:squalene/phytoene synthase family protein [Anaerolineales bacterium]